MPATPAQKDAIKSLSLAKKRELLQRLLKRKEPMPTSGQGGRLVAFVKTADDTKAFNAAVLRSHCDTLLPAHMVPQNIVRLDAMPVSASGKVDRAALANYEVSQPMSADSLVADVGQISASAQREESASTNAIEQQLIDIWEAVLVMEGVTVEDNFFEVGGDSLQIIRILSRAAKAGIRIKPDVIFSHPTIASQAKLATVDAEVDADQNVVTGNIPLLPIQEWFFQRIQTDQHWWNQSFLFDLRSNADLTTAHLKDIVRSVLSHHDALRTRFNNVDGNWRASIADMPEELPVQIVDISDLDVSQQMQAISEHASTVNEQLNLQVGPLIQFVLYKKGTEQGNQLLICAHHLIVDGESWQVIITDFQAAWQQLEQGGDITLSAKTSSAKLWSQRLRDFSQGAEGTKLKNIWQDVLMDSPMVLPHDAALASPQPTHTDAINGSGVGHESATVIVRTMLRADVSGSLLEEVAQNQTIRMHYLLLAALAQALNRWTGSADICLDMEGHGREALFDDIDLSRTVGWFTTVFPVHLRAPAVNGWGSFTAALRTVKEYLQALPYNGLGHGLINDQLPQIPKSQVLFNYLGQQIVNSASDDYLVLKDNRCGQSRSSRCEKAYALEVNMFIDNQQLICDWSFNKHAHTSETIETLAKDFMHLLTHRHSAESSENGSSMTPADFPLAGLNQDELDSIGGLLDDLDDE